MIRVDIWSDILCPFCYIGKRRFYKAVEISAAQVDIHWRSFELAPGVRPNKSANYHELLANKYGRSHKWAQEMTDYMAEEAKQLGIQMDFDKIVPTNSFDAHRILYLAQEQNQGEQANEEFFKAYFEEGLDLQNPEDLIQIAGRSGLKENKVRELLRSDQFSERVKNDQEEAYKYNITGVPAFIFNQESSVSGAQPVETFVEVLEKLKAQSLSSSPDAD